LCAEELVSVVIDPSGRYVQMIAWMRGPGLPQSEAQIDAMLGAVRLG
jgi:hypothetical protein